MLVKQIMTRAVRTISPETKLQEVASLMCLNRFSSLPVVAEGDILVGIIAERDILSYLFPKVQDFMDGMAQVDFEKQEADYKKILPLKAADLMTKGVISIAPDMPLLKAVSVMAKNNFRRVPVAENKKLVGIISLGDIHRAFFLESFSANK